MCDASTDLLLAQLPAATQPKGLHALHCQCPIVCAALPYTSHRLVKSIKPSTAS